jgi:hypothetical protein
MCDSDPVKTLSLHLSSCKARTLSERLVDSCGPPLTFSKASWSRMTSGAFPVSCGLSVRHGPIGEAQTPSCLWPIFNAFLTSRQLLWTSFVALRSLLVTNVLRRLPAVVRSQCATLTLWRGADSMFPLETLRRVPNGFAVPMDLQSRSPRPSGQEWLPAPSSCRLVAMCDTDPLERRRLHVAS